MIARKPSTRPRGAVCSTCDATNAKPAAVATTSSVQVDSAVAAMVKAHRPDEPRQPGLGRASTESGTAAGATSTAGLGSG